MKPQSTIQAEKKVKDIIGAIHYDHTSLTHALIKAHKGGMAEESIQKAFMLVEMAHQDAKRAVAIAIAQPEQKPAIYPDVNL